MSKATFPRPHSAAEARVQETASDRIDRLSPKGAVATPRINVVFICALSVHLISEIVRRFFVYTDLAYVVADLIFVMFALVAAHTARAKIEPIPLIFLASYFLWGWFCLLVEGGSAGLLLVGLRPLVLAASAYVLSYCFFANGKHPMTTQIWTITFWVSIVLAVGAYQLYAGMDAPINHLPAAAEGDNEGIGDYAAYGFVLESLFRPTSIFMHTGRLGQFAFMTTTVLGVSALTFTRNRLKLACAATAGILLVLLSGQRAAMLFLAGALLWTILKSGDLRVLGRIGLAILLLVPLFFFFSADTLELVSSRFASGLYDVGDRFNMNAAGAWVGIDNFMFFGKGIGFFSFGGKPFGGQVYDLYMRQFGGGGENAWLRIDGETGLPGLFLFVCTMTWMCWRAFSRMRAERTPESRTIHFIAGYSAIALAGWSLTHDVYGNYLMLMQLFLFFGASSGEIARKQVPGLANAAGLSPNVELSPGTSEKVFVLPAQY